MIEPNFWRGRRVFLTGHTGLKGAWASLLLAALGAKVNGFALPPNDAAGVFQAVGVERDVDHRIGDIRDLPSLSAAMADAQPEIVIHMAAQSLVKLSYDQPVETYATNVIGTAHVLETVRHMPAIRAVVVVTSDKCYENIADARAYRETDRLGGNDPYSSSKACAEIVTAAYRKSFFSTAGTAAVASARAGNVIGGGDWARDRLVPDAMRAFIAGEKVNIRNPQAIRPWQYVLDPVIGYLVLAQHLAAAGRDFANEWNFGPDAASEVSVAALMDNLVRAWGGDDAGWQHDEGQHPPESAILKLDSEKARTLLGWRPLFDLNRAIALTADWYRALSAGADIRTITCGQIGAVVELATALR